jgi:hypothetical protein
MGEKGRRAKQRESARAQKSLRFISFLEARAAFSNHHIILNRGLIQRLFAPQNPPS